MTSLAMAIAPTVSFTLDPASAVSSLSLDVLTDDTIELTIDESGGFSVTISGIVDPVSYNGTFTQDVDNNPLSAGLFLAGPICLVRPQVVDRTGLNGTLSLTEGLWLYDSSSGIPAITRQWYRGGAPVPGATGLIYSVTGPDGGQDIEVVETVTGVGAVRTAQSNVISIASSSISWALSHEDSNRTLSQDVINFTDVNFGAEDPDRELYVLFSYLTTGFTGAAVPFTVSVDGVGASAVISHFDGNDILGVGIAKIAKPTGVSGTVSIHAQGGSNLNTGRCAISVVQTVKPGGTSVANAVSAGSLGALTLDTDTSSGEVVLALSFQNTSGGANLPIWTGLTSQGTPMDVDTGEWHSIAAQDISVAETPRGINVSANNPISRHAAVAVAIS